MTLKYVRAQGNFNGNLFKYCKFYMHTSIQYRGEKTLPSPKNKTKQKQNK